MASVEEVQNPRENPEKCKVVFVSGTDERYCILFQELKEFEDRIYKLPDINIAISKQSYSIFRYPGYKAFLAIPTKSSVSGVPLYVLKPLGEDVVSRYRSNTLVPSDLQDEYKPPKALNPGSFGETRLFPTEKIVVKTSTSRNQYKDVTADIVREISFYRLLSEITCLPQLFDFETKPYSKLFLQMGEMDLFTAMEEGKLEDKLREKLIMLRLAKCLRVISSQGVIHLDLKPENCILLEGGKVQLIDWGFSVIDKSKRQSTEKPNRGTLNYMAPEILLPFSQGKERGSYTHKADIFSLGLLYLFLVAKGDLLYVDNIQSRKLKLLRALLKINPVSTDDIDLKMQEQINGDDTSSKISSILAKKFDVSLSDLIGKMLVFNPEHRIDYDDIILHPYFQDVQSEELLSKLPIFINDMPIIPNIAQFWPNILLRPKSLSVMKEICRKASLSLETLCTSVQLVDLFMFQHKTTEENTLKVCCSAVSLASKCYDVQEIDLEVLSTLGQVSTEDITDYNQKVLAVLNGNLLIPTFYSYYSHLKGALERNDPAYSTLLQIYLPKNVYAVSMREKIKV